MEIKSTLPDGAITYDDATGHLYVTVDGERRIFDIDYYGIDHPELYETTKDGKMVQIV